MTFRLATLWLRIEVSRRWRPLVLLVVLVALSTGALLASVAGARRGASAADRLLDQTLPATAIVHTGQTQIDYWPQVRRLPGVAAVSTFPAYSGFGVDEAPAGTDTVGVYLPLDADAMRTIERPAVLAGRLANPDRPDEAVVTQRFADLTGRGVGDHVTLRLFSTLQIDTGVSAVPTTVIPRPDGPAVRTTIVGIVRSPWFSDQVGGRGQLIPSPALTRAYPKSVLGQNLDSEKWALVRLSDGDAGLGRLRQQMSALVTGTPGPDILPRSDAIEHLRRVTRFEAACLLGLAAAVLLAACFVVGTAVTRQVAASRQDLGVVAALGATRAQTVALSAIGPAIAGTAGALAGAVLAVAVSGWFPFGVAATLEPAPGPQLDALVIGLGTALAIVVVAGWAVLSSAVLQRFSLAPRMPRAARAAVSSGLPVPVLVGLRHALEPGTGRGAIPVRSAVTGAVVGVLGVAAALTFATAVGDAASTPQRFGQTYQLVVAFGYSGTDLTCAPAAMRMAAQDRSVRSITDLRFQTAQLGTGSSAPGSDRTITVFSAAQPAGPPVLVAGEAAGGPDDIVLAPTTARRIGAVVGSRVPLRGQLPGAAYGATGADVPEHDPCAAAAAPGAGAGPPPESPPGDRTSAMLTVSGIGFVPQTQYNEYDSGAWVNPETYSRLFGTGFVNHEALISLAPGADPGAVAARLVPAFASIPGHQSMFTSYPAPIRRVAEMGDLRILPLVLSVFLAALGLAATGHVLQVAARRRDGELAVLRALGMTRPQARLVSITQAFVYAVAGLAIGIPLGVALGRTLWRVVAGSTPLAYVAPLPVAVLLLAIPLTLGAVEVLAVPAGRRTVRMRVADALRAE